MRGLILTLTLALGFSLAGCGHFYHHADACHKSCSSKCADCANKDKCDCKKSSECPLEKAAEPKK